MNVLLSEPAVGGLPGCGGCRPVCAAERWSVDKSVLSSPSRGSELDAVEGAGAVEGDAESMTRDSGKIGNRIYGVWSVHTNVMSGKAMKGAGKGRVDGSGGEDGIEREWSKRGQLGSTAVVGAC